MSKYLSSDLKFLNDAKSMIKSTISFTLGMLPKDLPFNPGYGVEIPKDFIVEDFCESYKTNLVNALNYLGLKVNVESVTLENKDLEVKIKFNNDEIETWRLTL